MKKKRDKNDNFFRKIQFLVEIYKIYLIFDAFFCDITRVLRLAFGFKSSKFFI